MNSSTPFFRFVPFIIIDIRYLIDISIRFCSISIIVICSFYYFYLLGLCNLPKSRSSLRGL